MTSMLNVFGKLWLEFWGRSRTANRYIFRENEIVTAGFPMNVFELWSANYLNLHPTHYAVAIGPDGRIINLRGGYNRLSPGRYSVHFVDKQNRVALIPRTTETTFDGFQVSLELVVTYRVIDPIKALEVQYAVDTLIKFIQSDLKEFIRSHTYDEIVGDMNGHRIDNKLVADFIKEQHTSRHQMSKLFLISDIVVDEKIGDPKVIQIRENFQVKHRQNLAESELLRQNQDLEKKIESQAGMIKQIKAEAEATEQEIRQKMEMQKIDLEKARAELQFRQEKWTQAMDAIAQALSSQTYPRDPQIVEIIRELLGAMGASSSSTFKADSLQTGSPSGDPTNTPNPEKIDSLTKTLLNLLKRNRS